MVDPTDQSIPDHLRKFVAVFTMDSYGAQSCNIICNGFIGGSGPSIELPSLHDRRVGTVVVLQKLGRLLVRVDYPAQGGVPHTVSRIERFFSVSFTSLAIK